MVRGQTRSKQMEEKGFVPPQEILTVERDTWYDRYQRHPNVANYAVVYKCSKGLKYSVRTWASDEMDAYTRVMNGDVIAAPPEESLS